MDHSKTGVANVGPGLLLHITFLPVSRDLWVGICLAIQLRHDAAETYHSYAAYKVLVKQTVSTGKTCMCVCKQFAMADHAADKCLPSDSDAKGISHQISHMNKTGSSQSCQVLLINVWFERPRCVSDTALGSLHSTLGWRCWSSAPIAGNHTAQLPRIVFLVCCIAVTASVLVA